jgi:hypothetical protein
MDKAVLDSAVAFAATFLATAFTPLGEVAATWVRVHITRSEVESKGLRGRWAARWTVEYGSYSGPRVIDDRIHVTKVRGSKFSGEGDIAPGVPDRSANARYKIAGVEGRYALDVRFCGQGRERDLVGSAIMKLDVNQTRLTGYWWQYGRDGVIFGGTTTWLKQLD